jgi:pimeloyl-ACP methyl ester carboxylesterase
VWRVAVLAAVLVLTLPAGASARRESRAITSKAVTFSVENVNRSKLTCSTDGNAYAIKGHVTGPRSLLTRSSRRRPAATLYLHGLGFGEWFWRFPRGGTSEAPLAPKGVPAGYNYAVAQAKAGHISVTIDRLGYDASGHPEGSMSCLGGQADIAHQVLEALRRGSYSLDGGKPIRFKKVSVLGHSIGAQIAMIEAYSFKDADALVLAGFSFQNLPRAQLAFGPARDSCLAGGQRAEFAGPPRYAYFGQPTSADFQSIMFHSARRVVKTYATAFRNQDPCGDLDSIIAALLQQRTQLSKIKVPVLVICGTNDALYAPLGCRMQADRFTRSRSVTVELVRSAGHALALERSAPRFRRKLARWLAKRGF